MSLELNGRKKTTCEKTDLNAEGGGMRQIEVELRVQKKFKAA